MLITQLKAPMQWSWTDQKLVLVVRAIGISQFERPAFQPEAIT